MIFKGSASLPREDTSFHETGSNNAESQHQQQQHQQQHQQQQQQQQHREREQCLSDDGANQQV